MHKGRGFCYNIRPMTILGEPLFAKDANGRLKSRVGTIFFKTPGLVTTGAFHAMQRMEWIEHVNKLRGAEGLPPMTEAEEDAELEQSVDLIFTDHQVLIRPDPNRVDLAVKADEELQKLVSKRNIRYLNTHSAKVRNALRARGENWRMARQPISQDDIKQIIESSRVAILGEPTFYYYNSASGTRYATVAGSEMATELDPATFRAQLKEAQVLFARRNRLGNPELDLFPVTTPIEIKQKFKALEIDSLNDRELCAAVHAIDAEWRMSIPPELRVESLDNYDWRMAMAETITRGPNETAAGAGELIQGISPEFYRQIEWLPGARVIDNGEVIFDSIWEEYNRTRDPALAEICDLRVKNIIFALTRFFADLEYINIGRITRSLARDSEGRPRRRNVYICQCKSTRKPLAAIYMLTFQKWGIAEHLDEGKDLLRSIIEANEYADYIMDRRLMCQQLGMNLPHRVAPGSFTEKYYGRNQYNGTTVRAYYYLRSYVNGTASDKIPLSKYRNPAFALKFAELMGEAAALDLVVGRRTAEKENLFDKYYEVIQIGSDGLPVRLVVTDHSGSFASYQHALEDSVAPYANVVRRRAPYLTDVQAFADAYVGAFERKLAETQQKYRDRRRAFDELFVHRPYDVGGSGAYRWAKTLERLDHCDPALIAERLRRAINA